VSTECSAEVIGAPFQILEYRAGEVLRGEDLGPLAETPDAGEALTNLLVGVLSALHQVDPAAVGLETLGRPEGFYRRNAEGWLKRGRAAARDDVQAGRIEQIGAWLLAQSTADRPATLLHCDFKLDNCILALEPTLTTQGVVDWDMCTRGDPLFDLATLLSYWAEPTDPDAIRTLGQMPTARGGFPGRAEVVRRYAAATGFELGDFPAFRILAMLKLGVVFLQLHDQWRQGAVSDPAYEAFERRGGALLDLACDSLGETL
jgi:aminoglycoside phosphotransferase (APT) family kinase protein